MPKVTFKMPSLFGGISRQPLHLRQPNQVEEAENVSLTVANGASKRPGSRLDRGITIASYPATGLRLHAIERDSSERYVLLYGDDVLRSFRVGTLTECMVYQHSTSRVYLDNVSADDWRLVTIADTTLVSGTGTAIAAIDAPAYQSSGEFPTATDLFSLTPGAGTYWRAATDDPAASAGYWRYKPGVSTFATISFATANAEWANTTQRYGAVGYNPMGAKIFFGQFPLVHASTTWTTATRVLTFGAGSLLSLWTFQDGQYVNITVVGTGGTAGYYKIARRIDANSVELVDSSYSGSNQSGMSVDGIGRVADISVDFDAEPPASVYDAAAAFQRHIRDALGFEACCAWVKTNDGAGSERGHFVVSSPFSGPYAHFPATAATRAPSAAGTYDMSGAVNRPFYSVGATIAAGTGYFRQLADEVAVDDRWVRVPAPSAARALIDRATAPQQLQRAHSGGTWNWKDMTTALKPLAWWRWDTAAGQTACFDTATGYTNATMSSSAMSGFVGPVAIATSWSAKFFGAEYVNVGTPIGFGSGMGRGFTVEFPILTALTTRFAVIGLGSSITGTAGGVELHIRGNTANGTSDTANNWWFHLADTNGLKLSARASGVTFNDSNFHHVAVTFNPATNTITAYVDGTALTVVHINQATPAVFADNDSHHPMIIGGWLATATTALANAFTGFIGELALHPGVFDAPMALARGSLMSNASYSLPCIFVLSPVDWTPRFSGGPDLNPLPTMFDGKRTVTAMAYFNNRFWMAGGPYMAASGVDDLFTFFNADADNPVDSDPISAPLSDTTIANVTDMTPFRTTMVVLTDGPRQFDVSSDGNLTPSTVTITASTAFHALDVRPVVMDQSLYYLTSSTNGSCLREHFEVANAVLLDSFNVTAHVEGLLPDAIRTMRAHSQSQRVFILNDSRNTIFVYTSFWLANKKEQSAWAEWTWSEAFTVEDIAVLGDELWSLVKAGSVYTLERTSCWDESDFTNANGSLNETVHLDRQYVLLGVAAAGVTTWTFPVSDTTINRAVLISGASKGTELTVSSSGTAVTITGSYAVYAVVGRAYTSTIELSQPFRKDPTGASMLNERTAYREMIVRHRQSGAYTVTASKANAANRTCSLSSTVNSPEEDGYLRTFPIGSTRQNTVTITNATARPSTISAVECVMDVDARMPH